jgi:hypothetical protein
MKRRIALFAAPLLVGSLAFAIPFVSHAGVGSGTCTTATPSPSLTPSGNVQPYPQQLDSKGVFWADSNKQQIGTKGSHGYLAADTKNGVRGYSTDSTLAGYAKPNSSNPPASSACVSVAGNKITAP